MKMEENENRENEEEPAWREEEKLMMKKSLICSENSLYEKVWPARENND